MRIPWTKKKKSTSKDCLGKADDSATVYATIRNTQCYLGWVGLRRADNSTGLGLVTTIPLFKRLNAAEHFNNVLSLKSFVQSRVLHIRSQENSDRTLFHARTNTGVRHIN